MHETSGVLAPVVRKYLAGDQLDADELDIMRDYLRQWVAAPGFIGPDIDSLRAGVDQIRSTADLRAWLADAMNAGIDPL
jgi:hypothetical protein